MAAQPAMTDEADLREKQFDKKIGMVLGTVTYGIYWGFLVTCLVFPVATQSAVGAKLTILPALCGLVSFTVCQIIVAKTGHLAGGKA